MSFSDLPAELVRGVFEEVFVHDWVLFPNIDRALNLRLVCKEFDHHVQYCAFSTLRITEDVGNALRRINSSTLTNLLQQKVRLPQGNNDVLLVRKIREMAYILERHRMDRGDSSNEVHVIHEEDLDILCAATIANLGKSRILELITEWDDPTTVPGLLASEQEIHMISVAAAVGYTSLIEDLLKEGVRPQFDDGLIGSALLAAAVGGHGEVIRTLVEAGANIEANVTHESSPVLYIAAEYGRDAAVRVLLEKGAKVVVSPKERHALYYAMNQGGHERVVLELLRHGANINARSGHDETVLHYAARIGVRAPVLDLLLAHGADLEAKNGLNRTALFIAAFSNRLDMFHALLARGANINTVDTVQRTLLHHLILHRPRLTLLLKHGIAVNARDEAGNTALHLVATSRSLSAAELLLAAGADVNAAARDGATPLHRSIDSLRGPDDLPRLLVAHGARVNVRTSVGRTALHDAAERGHESVVRLLLGVGAEANAATATGFTPLHGAALRPFVGSVSLLLAAGADINARTVEGVTPLHLAAVEGLQNIVGMLLAAGADVNARTTSFYRGQIMGGTALHLSASKRDLISLLVKAGAELEVKDENGMTPLFRAGTIHNSVVTVPHLLDLGADINCTDLKGDTVLHWNARMGVPDVATLLLDRGIIVNARNNAGETALHCAARGYSGIVQSLLDHGADIDALDGEGRTALLVAANWSNGHQGSMAVLVSRGADMEVKDREGRTALQVFRLSGREKEHIDGIWENLAARRDA